MSFLSNLIKKAAPIVATVAPGTPVGTAAAVVSAAQAQQDLTYRRKLAEEQQARQNMEFFSNAPSSIPTINANMARTTPIVSTQSSGGGFFDTIRGGLREVGGFVGDVFSSGLPQLFGVNRPAGIIQQPAVATTANVGAQESQGSGTIQAGIGSALAPALQAARGLLRSPGGQLAIGTGAGLALQGTGSQGSGMRITRKMKSQAKMVLNMTGGNLSAAAQMLGVDEQTLVMILLKRFRNDGPVVTKAALRKTRQTVRRLKSMSDMLDSLRPTAARRRAPMKRASTTTLIKN